MNSLLDYSITAATTRIHSPRYRLKLVVSPVSRRRWKGRPVIFCSDGTRPNIRLATSFTRESSSLFEDDNAFFLFSFSTEILRFRLPDKIKVDVSESSKVWRASLFGSNHCFPDDLSPLWTRLDSIPRGSVNSCLVIKRTTASTRDKQLPTMRDKRTICMYVHSW